MTTIQVHDNATPALRQVIRRLANRRLILHLTKSGYRKTTVQKPTPQALRVMALFGKQPTTIAPARERYVLVGGQKTTAARVRALLVGGCKYPTAASQSPSSPVVRRQVREAALDLVREEIEAVLRQP